MSSKYIENDLAPAAVTFSTKMAVSRLRLAKRWIVERTLAWISRNRHLARDFRRYARTVAACIHLAMIRIISLSLEQVKNLRLTHNFTDRLLD